MFVCVCKTDFLKKWKEKESLSTNLPVNYRSASPLATFLSNSNPKAFR